MPRRRDTITLLNNIRNFDHLMFTSTIFYLGRDGYEYFRYENTCDKYLQKNMVRYYLRDPETKIKPFE